MTYDKQGLRLHGPVALASATTTCWKCKQVTPVHAILAHDLEAFEPGQAPERIEAETFVYELDTEALPATVRTVLSRLAPNYRPLYSRTLRATTWANACVHCGVLQGAFFLHSEPDGPFLGRPEDGFAGSRVVVAEQGFDVDGASYSV